MNIKSTNMYLTIFMKKQVPSFSGPKQ